MIIKRKSCANYFDPKQQKIIVSFEPNEFEKEVSDEIGKRYNELTGQVSIETKEISIEEMKKELVSKGVKVDGRWKDERIQIEYSKL